MKNKLLDKPKRVQKRYFRLKFYRNSNSFFMKILLLKLRISLIISEKKRIKILDSTFNTMIKERNRLDKDKFQALNGLYNISMFFLLAEKDLAAIKIDALTHSNPWKRNLSLRIMLLIIHERDITKVASGKTLNYIYSHLNINEKLKNKLVDSFRNMKKIQDKINYILKDIRNNSIAHRDKDAMLQYQTINGINILKIKDILNEYSIASNNIMKSLITLTQQLSTLSSLLSQYSEKEKN